MHSRPSRPAREGGLLRLLVISASFAATIAPAGTALAQGAPPPAKPPTLGAPPPKAPDMELDLDAPKQPEKKEEAPPPPPLPPAEAGAWGVGGKDEEGNYAPGANKKKVEVVDEDKGPRVLGPPGAAAIDMVVGFGGMHDITKGSDLTKFTVLSLVFGAQYRFGESLTIGARFPYSTGSIVGPANGAGDDFNTFAVGNLEVSGRYSIALTRRLALPIDLAIYLPTASGDLFAAAGDQGAVAQYLVNQAAAYSRGFEENPLFASKRLGIRVGAGIAYDKNQIHVEGHMRLDVMGKTGGNPPTGSIGLHTPDTTWLTGASFSYDFFDGKLTPSLRAWLAVTTLPVFSGTRDDSGAQFVLEPSVYGRFPLNAPGSLALRGGLGYVLPIAGTLGGGQGGATESTSTGGLRVHAEFQF
jgi:hypothetical protein